MDDSRLYTEEVEDILRLCLPVEDIHNGLYIHPMSVRLASITTAYDESGEMTNYYVRAEDFMDMQKERDELRKTLSLLNAVWRSAPLGNVMAVFKDQGALRIQRLLDKAGFTADAAKATQGIVDWAESEPKT